MCWGLKRFLERSRQFVLTGLRSLIVFTASDQWVTLSIAKACGLCIECRVKHVANRVIQYSLWLLKTIPDTKGEHLLRRGRIRSKSAWVDHYFRSVFLERVPCTVLVAGIRARSVSTYLLLFF